MNKDIIFIAGGGTGGHVYPALAIAEALTAINPQCEIHFFGTKRGIEKLVIPTKGYPLHLIPIGRFNNISSFEKIKTIVFLPIAFLKAFFLLLKYKPKVVLGVGGYASLPVVLVAAWMGKKTFIWEPNAHAGMANRILSKWVDRALVVFENTKKHLKSKNIQLVGLPVRAEIESAPASLDHTTFNVLVFGGSQGARGINKTVSDAIVHGGSWLDNVEIVHQVGKYDLDEVRKKYQGLKTTIQAHEYLHDMEARYTWADLVVCRSGASTVAELAASSKAALLIPFPGAADEHQQKNAENLESKGAAVMCLQSDFSTDYFIEQIRALKLDFSKLKSLSKNIKQFHHHQAAKQIAEIILK